MMGGAEVSEVDVAKLDDLGKFLTGNEPLDREIMKFTTRDFKQRYGLNDLDNSVISYKFSEDQKEEYRRDAE